MTPVVVVSPGYPPAIGGVEEHVHQICTHLAAAGRDVTVLTAARGVRRRTVTEQDGVRIVTYPAWAVPRISLSPRLLWAAWRIPASAPLVHVHSFHASTGLATLRRRRGLVFTPHYHGGGHSPLARALHVLHRRIAGRMFANSARVICVSAAEQAHLVEDHPQAEGRTTVVPNGVDVALVRAASPWPDAPPTVLSLGRLEDYKRIDVLVRAMSTIAAPARLVVVGDGPHRAALEELVRELDLTERVTVAGRLADDDVVRWLATADVLVSLSAHEAFGMAPLEAASSGARVVLSDIPAHREIATEYLPGHATLVADPAPDVVAAAVSKALVAGRTTPAAVPTWAYVATRTAHVIEEVAGS